MTETMMQKRPTKKRPDQQGQPAGMTAPQWKRCHTAIEARLESLLKTHTFPRYHLQDVPQELSGLTGRDRVRCLSLLISGANAVGKGRLSNQELLAALLEPGQWPASPLAQALERRKMLLIRLVMAGCRKRGEL